MKKAYTYSSPVGNLTLIEDQGSITGLMFGVPSDRDDLLVTETPLLKKAAGQLSEYFDGKRKQFDLPINPSGTEFEHKVWNALCGIPYGQTETYGQVAARIENPKASRAVGGANNRNPIAIIIPCHRVIGSTGKMVGYAGGLEVKKFLLTLEKTSDPNLLRM